MWRGKEDNYNLAEPRTVELHEKLPNGITRLLITLG
jgi:hypothetical protein